MEGGGSIQIRPGPLQTQIMLPVVIWFHPHGISRERLRSISLGLVYHHQFQWKGLNAVGDTEAHQSFGEDVDPRDTSDAAVART